jgi:hypothetical protein
LDWGCIRLQFSSVCGGEEKYFFRPFTVADDDATYSAMKEQVASDIAVYDFINHA